MKQHLSLKLCTVAVYWLICTISVAQDNIYSGKLGLNTTHLWGTITSKDLEISHSPSLQLLDYSQGDLSLFTSLSQGNYGPMVQQGDMAMIWTDNSGALNQSAGLVIMPRKGALEGMRITSEGKVGIGIPQPKAKLDVWGMTRSHGFYTEKNNFIVTTNGRVGIGNVSPQAGLDVDGGAILDELHVEGQIGIGTASPQSELDVVGTIHAHGIHTSSANNVFSSEGNTNFRITSSAAFPTVCLQLDGYQSKLLFDRRMIIGTEAETMMSLEGQHGTPTSGIRIAKEFFVVSSLSGAGTNHKVGLSAASNLQLGGSLFVAKGSSGAVGICTENFYGDTDAKLLVNGKIHAKEVEVTTMTWADYVFDDNYNLMPLSDVQAFVEQEHHLPGIPSTAEVLQQGIALGEMNRLLLQKIEELTLYVIQQQSEIDSLKADRN